jgi:putative SOS response-associated peptidase YedK
MCANYRPSTSEELMAHFGVAPPDTASRDEAFPGYLAPIIRKPHSDAAIGERAAVAAIFGMVPHWAELKLSRSTYNARSETVASKPSFRNAWRHGQFCIVPAAIIYEPCYESGKPVREAITSADGSPLGIAGIWESKKADNGLLLFSFSMLTINADDHPLMRRLHKPTDEKRMVVMLPPDRYDAWLHCPVDDALSFITLCPAPALQSAPAPKIALRAAQQPMLDA